MVRMNQGRLFTVAPGGVPGHGGARRRVDSMRARRLRFEVTQEQALDKIKVQR
jgi:hypothetical protein